ncbi:MAG: hypothetical protein PHF86_08620 [Candidatus Nanoarchaeia archaeon]|nr:hypothetical protein [Candidatus Nanoarchaeia archaeon]
MMCDIRKMPAGEVLPILHKMQREANTQNCDIKFDDEDHVWFIQITNDSCWLAGSKDWRFDASARGGDLSGNISWFFMSYYPPSGGNVRFDANVGGSFSTITDSKQISEAIEIYKELLVKYGHAGKNTIARFEDLSEFKEETCSKPKQTLVKHFLALELSSKDVLSKLRKLFQ